MAGRFREIAGKLDFIELREGKWNPARPHSIRAAFRSKMAKAGVDSILVKYWMGWELGPKEDAYITLEDDDLVSLYKTAEKFVSLETTSEEILVGKIGDLKEIDDEYRGRLGDLEGGVSALSKALADRDKEIDRLTETTRKLAERLGNLEGLKERIEELKGEVEALRKEAERARNRPSP